MTCHLEREKFKIKINHTNIHMIVKSNFKTGQDSFKVLPIILKGAYSYTHSPTVEASETSVAVEARSSSLRPDFPNWGTGLNALFLFRG